MSVHSVVRTDYDGSTNQDLFKDLLYDIFYTADRPAEVGWKEVCLDLKSSDEYERFMRIAGMERGGEVPEGQNIPISAPKYGSTQDFTQVSYGAGFRITKRMDKFNKYKLGAKFSKNLRLNMEELKDVEVAKMFNTPTATTYASGYDGLSLANNNHTCLDDSSTTYDNNLGSALSTSSIESALAYFDYMYDDMGYVFSASPSHLVFAPQLKILAHELIGGPLKPHEISNTNATYTDLYPFKLYSWIHLTSPTSCFMIAKNHELFDLKVITSQEPMFYDKEAPDYTLDHVYMADQYFKYGFGDPRCYYLINT